MCYFYKKNYLYLLLFISILLPSIFISLNLRPSADDYCFAEKASLGFFEGIYAWWTSWIGHLSGAVILNALVGFPIAEFQWYLASAIPFWITTLSVSLIFSSFLQKIGINISYWKLIVLSSSLWILYVSILNMKQVIPYNFVIWNELYLIASSLFHWQNIGVGYIVVLVPIFFSCFILVDNKNKYLSFLLSILLGVYCGFLSFVIVLFSIVSLILALFLYAIIKKQVDKERVIHALIFISTASFCTWLATQSPGYLFRSSTLEVSFSIINNAYEMLIFILPFVLKKFPLFYLNPAFFASVIFFFIVFYKESCLISTRILLIFLVILTTGSFLMFGVIRSSEFFSYSAFWHYTPNLLLAFLSSPLVSLLLVNIVYKNKRFFRWLTSNVCMLVVVFLVSFFTFTVLNYTYDEVSIRLEQWNQGPAPMPGISDIEDPDGWQMKCWNSVVEYRKVPNFRK